MLSARNIFLIILLGSYYLISFSYADQTIINNDGNTGQVSQPTQSPCSSNQKSYDPRVPPAGVYHNKNNQDTTYTTGGKKPYIVDNNCNPSSTAPIQPYVIVPSPSLKK